MLKVVIDRGAKKARFSGDSTFAAKDQIKRIWSARWLGPEKSWEASQFIDSVDELKEKLFDFELIIEELGSAPVVEVDSTSSIVPKGLSVPQVIFSAKAAVEERFDGGVLVFGVVSSLKSTGANRTFLTLSDIEDRTLSISCVYWNDVSKLNHQLSASGIELAVDLEVMFQVEITLNPKNGNLSAKINRIIPEYTLAKLQGERDKTNQRLKDEGIFERNKKLTIPFLPINIGVLTSSTGTVIFDFMTVLEEANFGFNLIWLPVSVQGASSKSEILKGISELGKRADLDLIVLFRGGGGVSDLAVFNSYEVAREIALCPLPVLSAIGHQEDQSSVQDVSNRSFGVPRDLGSFLAGKVIEVRNNIQVHTQSLHNSVTARLELAELGLRRASDVAVAGSSALIDRYSQRISSLSGSLALQSKAFVELFRERIERNLKVVQGSCFQIVQVHWDKVEQFKSLVPRMLQIVDAKERNLISLSAHVSDASPEVQLKRGYSIVKGKNGFLRSVQDVAKNDKLDIELIDGEIVVNVLERNVR